MNRSTLRIQDESDLVMARQAVRDIGRVEGLSQTDSEALATAVTEVARNMIVHATGGELFVGPLDDASRRGVAVTARDHGPGIADIELAMRDEFSTAGGLGLGLSSARRLVDEFEIESIVGVGTIVTMRKVAAGQ